MRSDGFRAGVMGTGALLEGPNDRFIDPSYQRIGHAFLND